MLQIRNRSQSPDLPFNLSDFHAMKSHSISSNPSGSSYSKKIAFVYSFNLIVGVGALSLPFAISKAGILLGLGFLVCLCFFSFITMTWVFESMAIGNARLFLSDSSSSSSSSFSIPTKAVTPTPFEITKRLEFGFLAELFLGDFGSNVFHAILIIYLFGDLAIYAAAIPQCLVVVTLAHFDIQDSASLYSIYLILFAIFIIPWTLFDFQKTRVLQLCTAAARNVALVLMIVLGITEALLRSEPSESIHWFEWDGFKTLFGVGIYAFICHHSLPGILTPIDDKSHTVRLMAISNTIILCCYILFCLTAVFAFDELHQLYTMNFASYPFQPIALFLSLYPVFTLSANYPLISITLRNNLLNLTRKMGKDVAKKDGPSEESKTRRITHSIGAVIPPFFVAYYAGGEKIAALVGVTGSYAGLCIMLIFPAIMVLQARKSPIFDSLDPSLNPYRSPFTSFFFIILILVFAGISALYMISTQFVNEDLPSEG